MGGYGSFKIALTTNNFACAGSFSGALGLSTEMIRDETIESKEYWQGVFGDLEGKDIEQHKLVNLAKQHDKKLNFLLGVVWKISFLTLKIKQLLI